MEHCILQNPVNYIKENEGYFEGRNTLVYRLASSEICRKFWRWEKDGTILQVTQEVFQGELTPQLAKHYIEFYHPANAFYTISFEFFQLGWLDTWFILREDNIPFFFFKKALLINILTEI